jgi:hypothetical protein
VLPSTTVGRKDGEEAEENGQTTLPVHLHKARVAKGVSRYRAMSQVMLPVSTWGASHISVLVFSADTHAPTHNTHKKHTQMEYRFDASDPRIRHLNFTSPPLTEPMEAS